MEKDAGSWNYVGIKTKPGVEGQKPGAEGENWTGMKMKSLAEGAENQDGGLKLKLNGADRRGIKN